MQTGITKLSNVFTDNELAYINNLINSFDIPLNDDGSYVSFKDNNGTGICEELGRIQIGTLPISDEIRSKLISIANQISEIPLELDHFLYAEYNNKYGVPVLPAHFDHDTNDLVFDFQLDSNTSWDLGVDKAVYSLENNSALIFNANKHIHWRPHKVFSEGEYVKMIFARFFNPVERSDYSNLDYTINHDVFKEVNEFRDSLNK